MSARSEHHDRTEAPRRVVIAAEQPVIDQSDATSAKWIAAGGDPRDQGRMVELVSRALTGSERMLVGLGWLQPGEIHLLHHHPHADEWYYVVRGSALFTVGADVIRGTPGTALFMPAGVQHRIENDGSETLEILWGFDRGELDEVGIVWDE